MNKQCFYHFNIPLFSILKCVHMEFFGIRAKQMLLRTYTTRLTQAGE